MLSVYSIGIFQLFIFTFIGCMLLNATFNNISVVSWPSHFYQKMFYSSGAPDFTSVFTGVRVTSTLV
jgi:hypothetical protein